MAIEFFIPYRVMPKQGDRVRVVQKQGRKPFAMHYQSSEIRKNAEALSCVAAMRRPQKPLTGPLKLELVFQYTWRTSEPQRNRKKAKLKDTRPDWDNLGKQLCDVLEHTGFFANDAQLADVRIKKVWTDTPGVQVRIDAAT